MEKMRSIVEGEIASLEGMQDVWQKMPDVYKKELVDLILQKMAWAERRGYDCGWDECYEPIRDK
jgi:hypothetical protein